MRRLRAAALSEVELAMDIINQAKAHLRAQGIDQWQTGYPDRDCLDAARGRGAAGTAFQLVEDLCRDRGVREFRVDTDAGNHKMQHILAKQGFQYRGTIRFDNSEKIAYEKRL